jgi:hypothetical protein
MLQIHGFKQDGLRVYYRDGNNNLILIADFENAFQDFNTPGTDGEQKRCNVASYLAEVALVYVLEQEVAVKRLEKIMLIMW